MSDTKAVKYEQEIPDILKAMAAVHQAVGFLSLTFCIEFPRRKPTRQ